MLTLAACREYFTDRALWPVRPVGPPNIFAVLYCLLHCAPIWATIVARQLISACVCSLPAHGYAHPDAHCSQLETLKYKGEGTHQRYRSAVNSEVNYRRMQLLAETGEQARSAALDCDVLDFGTDMCNCNCARACAHWRCICAEIQGQP